VTTTPLLAAAGANGLLTRASLDQSIKQLPARHRIGVLAFARYSQAADLANGVAWYTVLGVGTALLTLIAAGAGLAGQPPTAAAMALWSRSPPPRPIRRPRPGRRPPTSANGAWGRRGGAHRRVRPLPTLADDPGEPPGHHAGRSARRACRRAHLIGARSRLVIGTLRAGAQRSTVLPVGTNSRGGDPLVAPAAIGPSPL
jgi:hypothetical protein